MTVAMGPDLTSEVEELAAVARVGPTEPSFHSLPAQRYGSK